MAELLKIKGVGKAAACAIQAAMHLGRRLQQHVGNDKPHMGTPAEVAEYMLPLLRDKAQEEMHVLLLDNRHRLLRVECTRGLVAAGKVVGIEVLDHVVLGLRTPARPQSWFSLRQGGLM